MAVAEIRGEAILGPIIGLVTDTTARVLYEFTFTGEVEVTVQSCQYEDEQHIMRTRCFAGIPVAVEFSNLRPDARYKVFLPLDILCAIQQGSFATLSGRISMRPLMFAVVKGNKESVVKSLPPDERDLWKDLAQRCQFGDVDIILHLGDQVFADDVREVEAEDGHQPGEEDSVYVKSVKLLYEPGVEWKVTSKLSKEERADLESQDRFCKGASHHLIGQLLPENEWEACRELILEYYRELYRGTWGHLSTRLAHASASNIMLLDSHDICDSWGDRPCDRKRSTPEFFVGKLALQVYHEYQRQLREDIDFGPVVEPVGNEGFAQRWGDVGCIFVDVRCTRSFRCPPDMVQGDPPFIDDEQFQMIASYLGEWGRTGIRHVLLCTQTAPVLFSPQMTKVGGYFVDDCAEQFAFSHSDDQVKLLDMLNSWKTQDEGRSLNIYSGHLHIGQQTKILKDGELAMEQFMVKSVGGPGAGTQKALAFKMLGFGCSLHHAISSTWSFRHFDGVKAARSYGLVQCRLFSGDDDMPVVNHSVVTSDKENSLDEKELEHFLERGPFFEKGLVISLSDGLDQRRYTHVAGSGMTISDAALFSPVLPRHNPTSRSESRANDVPTLVIGYRVGTEPGPGLEKWEVRRVPGQLGNYVAPADDIELGKTPYQLGIKQGEFFAQRLDVGSATASNGVAFVLRHKDLGKQATNALASRPIPDQDEWKLEYALAYPADSKRPGAASAAFTTQVPGSEFVMHIQKAHHQQIGWDIATAADGDVVIRRVLPNTYLQMHNQVYPAKAATEGDRVMEVDGEKRDVQKIRELEMQRSHLTVHIKKAKPEPMPKAKAKPKAAPAAPETPVPFYKRFPCCQKQAAETLQAEKESEQIVDRSAALEDENTTLRRQLRIKEQENALIIKDKQDLAKQVKLQRKAVEEQKAHLHELQLHAELAHGRERESGPPHLHSAPPLPSHGPASSWEEIRHDAPSPSLELAVRKLQEENQDLAARLLEDARLREDMELQHRQAIQQISTRSQAGTAAEIRALKGDNERLLERNKQLSEQLELIAINDSTTSGMVDMDRENLLMAAQADKEELLEKTARLEQELSELYSKAAEPQSEGIVPPEVLGEIQRLRSDNEGQLSELDRLRAENEVLAERNVDLVRKSAQAHSRAASMDGSTRRMISATSHTADVEVGESSIAAVVASRQPQVMKPVVQTTKVVIPEVPQRLDTDLSRKIVKAEQLLTEGATAEPWQTLGPYIPPATVDAGLSTGSGAGRVRVLSPSRIVLAQPTAEGPSVPFQQPLSAAVLDLSQRSLPSGTAVSSQPAMFSACPPSGIIEPRVMRSVSGSACSPGREVREPIVANAAGAAAIAGVMPLGPEYVAPAPPVYLGVVPASQQSLLMQSQPQPQPSFTSFTGGQALLTNLSDMPGMAHEAGSSRLHVTAPSTTTTRTSTERWL